MLVNQSPKLSKLQPVIVALVLLVAFAIASWHLERESLWDDEGWSLWAVSGASVSDTLSRVQSDVHPPLYFLLLDTWVALAGESVYAVRLLSALAGLLGLAATFALGKTLFDGKTGIGALAILATSGFFVYYTRETRMYTLLLALSVLATLAYLHWRKHTTMRTSLGYAVLLAALLYTHYSGALIALTHAVRLILTSLRRGAWSTGELAIRPYTIAACVAPFVLAGMAYAPWVWVVMEQARLHGRPLALALPTDLNTVVSLALVVTSGAPLVFGLALVGALWRGRRTPDALLLLLLWLLVTPIALFALNAWVAPVYQVRYAIAALPAGALLVAMGINAFNSKAQGCKGTQRENLTQRNGETEKQRAFYSALSPQHSVLSTLFLVALLYVQLAAYPAFWHPKSRYGEAARQMTAARQPDEPLIADIYDRSATAYYDRLYSIRRGVFEDITWDARDIAHDRALASGMDAALPVWVVMPTNVARTWDVVAALDEIRGVGYRDSVMNILFYRFDTASGDMLRFRFGDAFAYEGAISQPQTMTRGESFCAALRLRRLAESSSLAASVQLLDAAERAVVSWNEAIPQTPTGELLILRPCLALPPDLPDGNYHVQLAVYDGLSLSRLPVIEGDDARLYWGDRLIVNSTSLH